MKNRTDKKCIYMHERNVSDLYLNLGLRIPLLNFYVWQVLLYNGETCILTTPTGNKIEAFEMRSQRRILVIDSVNRIYNKHKVFNRLNKCRQILQSVKIRKTFYLGLTKELKIPLASTNDYRESFSEEEEEYQEK